METAETHLSAAEQELRQGHAGAALNEARVALRLQPENGRALALMALAYTLMGDELEARRALSRAIESSPRDSTVRRLGYLTLVRIQDVEEARAQLTYFTQLEPENTAAKTELARIGGPVLGLPPLPSPPQEVLWYDGGGHALVGAGEIAASPEDEEPAPGPNVMVCSGCEKRTWKGWVCKHCGEPLPHDWGPPNQAAPGD